MAAYERYLTASSAGFLPKSGGTMTGTLYLSTGVGILDPTNGAGLLAYKPSGWNGVTNTQFAIGPIDAKTIIRSDGNDLIHYKYNTSYTIYDSSNCNNSTTNWTTKALNCYNDITVHAGSGGLKVMLSGSTYIPSLHLGTGGINRGIYDFAPNVNQWLIYFSASHTILGYGNVGIGCTSPAQKLHVSGSTRFEPTENTGFQIIRRPGAGYAGITYYPDNQTTNYWTSGSDGTSNSYRYFFQYKGTYVSAISTGGVFSTISDATQKENFRDIEYTTEDIAYAPAVTFDWIDGRGKSAGSIAQYWKDIIPELVDGEDGGMSLAYGQIALINSIILARENMRLRAEIEDLKRAVYGDDYEYMTSGDTSDFGWSVSGGTFDYDWPFSGRTEE